MKHRGVQNGTIVGREHLCANCREGVVVEGHSKNEVMTLCQSGMGHSLPVLFEVAQCSGFRRKDEKSLQSMREIAWEVKIKGPKVGFIRPGEHDHSETRN